MYAETKGIKGTLAIVKFDSSLLAGKDHPKYPKDQIKSDIPLN